MTSRELIDALLLKNRTIVSRDFADALDIVGRDVPLTIRRYPSGSEYGSWQIPPAWNLVHAELRGSRGVIASSTDHPLFVAPYSRAFSGTVSREDLLRRVRSNPAVPDAFVYEYRLAMNHRLRLADWMLTLPHRIVETLDEPSYEVDIRADVGPGEMLIGESRIVGSSPGTFLLLAHLCHPGQANDGLGGLAASLEVMKRIRREIPNPRYSYRLLVLPETIGSAVYVEAHPDELTDLLGALFIEMPGADAPLRLKRSRRGTTYFDRLFHFAMQRHGAPFDDVGFHEPYGNDELVFDFPGIGVPGLSVQRYPMRTYHTSRDDADGVDPNRLQEIVDITMGAVHTLERDYCVRFRDRGPVYLSRHDLYADCVNAPEAFALNTNLVERAWDGSSVFDIARQLGLDPDRAFDYLDRFVNLGLASRVPITPAYARAAQP